MSETGTRCRSCGGSALEPVLSLGEMPLANALVTGPDLERPERRFPLDLVFCPDCALVQISTTVPPELLFREYLYFSSFSDTMLEHSRALVERMIASRGLGPSSLVIEAASNDGYLLQFYRRAGIPVLGIEPARNVARVAVERHGIETLTEFFGGPLAERLRRQGRRADVMHANNVLAHVGDPGDFVRGFSRLLKEGGLAIFEVPYVKDMIDGCEFDTIYHEHLSYYSVTALDRLLRANGLGIVAVERIPIHGGSIRILATPETGAPSEAVQRFLTEERAWGVQTGAFYRGFGARVEALRKRLGAMLRDLKGQGKSMAAYGASAKGTTLLNYFGIGRETLDFVADRSTVKQGLYTPGTHIPILGPSALVEKQPDYVLLLTWNFADEILEQQSEYRRRGGRFIVPIPDVVIR